MGSDGLTRALAAGGRLRGLAAVTTDLVDEARRRHRTFPTATAALGRALTAAVLLGSTLKGQERISLQFNGDGPLREIFVEGDAHGHARGYVRRPAIHLPSRNGKLDVGRALGRKGTLSVLRSVDGTVMYQGLVPLVSGEIGKDVAYYLTVSEQVPSTVALGVFVEPDGRVAGAGGFMVQRMPVDGTPSWSGGNPGTLTDEEERIIERVEANLAPLPGVSTLVRQGATARSLLETALAGLGPRIIAEGLVAFACPCSRERVVETLATLGPDDLEQLAREKGGTTATCDFCNTEYRFEAAELLVLADELRAGGEAERAAPPEG